jgi:hypothetical protein
MVANNLNIRLLAIFLATKKSNLAPIISIFQPLVCLKLIISIPVSPQ